MKDIEPPFPETDAIKTILTGKEKRFVNWQMKNMISLE